VPLRSVVMEQDKPRNPRQDKPPAALFIPPPGREEPETDRQSSADQGGSSSRRPTTAPFATQGPTSPEVGTGEAQAAVPPADAPQDSPRRRRPTRIEQLTFDGGAVTTPSPETSAEHTPRADEPGVTKATRARATGADRPSSEVSEPTSRSVQASEPRSPGRAAPRKRAAAPAKSASAQGAPAKGAGRPAAAARTAGTRASVSKAAAEAPAGGSAVDVDPPAAGAKIREPEGEIRDRGGEIREPEGAIGAAEGEASSSVGEANTSGVAAGEPGVAADADEPTAAVPGSAAPDAVPPPRKRTSTRKSAATPSATVAGSGRTEAGSGRTAAAAGRVAPARNRATPSATGNATPTGSAGGTGEPKPRRRRTPKIEQLEIAPDLTAPTSATAEATAAEPPTSGVAGERDRARTAAGSEPRNSGHESPGHENASRESTGRDGRAHERIEDRREPAPAVVRSAPAAVPLIDAPPEPEGLTGAGLARTLRTRPGVAPAALALMAVRRFGGAARSYGEDLRRDYPRVAAERLVNDAVRRARRRAGLTAGGVLLGPVGVVAGTVAGAWVRARFVLEVSALYGRDALDPARAADLLVILGAYPDRESAVAAVAEVLHGEVPADSGSWPRRPALGEAATVAIARLVARALPGAAVLTAAVRGDADLERLTRRAVRHFRTTG